jgi:glycosyltransferase involved in cell wall biosynthesis
MRAIGDSPGHVATLWRAVPGARMRHALFIAFHFPPEASSSGVLRTLKYVRYLQDYGWRVTVITLRVDAFAVTDPGLETQVPTSCRVIRTPYLNVKQHLAIRGIYPSLLALPDTWIGWLPWGTRAGRKLHRVDPFDIVYSTSPHATAHLIAGRIAKRCRRPWVADFRDPWFEDPPEPGAPDGLLYQSIQRFLERKVIEGCDAVVTSTTDLRDLLRKRYDSQLGGKIDAILNGYDEADFADRQVPAHQRAACFLLLHAGSVNADFRDPRPLLSALRKCGDAGTIDLARVRVRLLGGGPFADSPELCGAIAQLQLRDVVETIARVPYAQSLEQLAASDMLLLLQASPDTIGLVPAKLYEYLRAQKPVLALVPAGATAEVLSMTGGGWAISPDNENALCEALAEAFRRWQNGTLAELRADMNVLRRFDRRELTGQLAQLFDRLVAGQAT